MMTTLQRYIGWELLKTFILTAIGLTLVFSLCGGVLNMIQAEVLTTVQMVQILVFVLPIATSLTMPVSALFASAVVYGRLSADNEFDACKASGINIHRLLMPVMVLSVLVAAFTFAFTNFVIPLFVEKLDQMVRKDLQKLVLQALGTQGYFKHGPFVIYAGRSNALDAGSETKDIQLLQTAFLEFRKGSLERAGTADEVRINFHAQSESGDPVVEAVMYDIRSIDLTRNQFYELETQPFDPVAIKSRLKQKPQWLTLPDLVYYRSRPTEMNAVREQLRGVQMLIRDALFYRHVISVLTTDRQVFEIEDDTNRYEIRGERIDPSWPDPALDDFRPRIDDAKVTQSWDEGERTFKADRCAFKVKRGFGEIPDTLQMVLERVGFTDSRDPDNPVERKRIDLPEVVVPPWVAEQESEIFSVEFSAATLTSDSDHKPLNLGTRIDDAQVMLRKEITKLSLKLNGIIHSRLAFSASVMVTLVLAAALGIIFKGGQILTAFMISFVPGLLVVVMNIMGRQLAENSGTAMIGVVIIWAGLVLVGVADAVVLRTYLRR